MAFLTWLREKSYRLWDASRMQDRHKLLIFLREAYRNQSENMTNLTSLLSKCITPTCATRLAGKDTGGQHSAVAAISPMAATVRSSR